MNRRQTQKNFRRELYRREGNKDDWVIPLIKKLPIEIRNALIYRGVEHSESDMPELAKAYRSLFEKAVILGYEEGREMGFNELKNTVLERVKDIKYR